MGEETDEYAESTSKLQEKIKALTGVDIMKDKDTFKDIYTIVLEIGKVWDSLADIDQAAVLEALAGKQQSNRLAAVFSNIDQLEAAYISALNAEGSALKEQENYSQSIQYSIDRAKASLEQLAATSFDTTDVKAAVEVFNSLLEAVNETVDSVGILIPLLSSFAAFSSVKNIGIARLGDSIETKGLQLYNFGWEEQLKKLEQQKATLQYHIDGMTKMDSSKRHKGYDETLAKFRAELADTDEQIATTTEGFTALGSVIKNIGVSIAVGSLISVIESVLTAENRLKKSVQEAGESYAKQSQTIDDTTAEIQKQYNILNSSTSSYTEQNEAREALYEIQKKLVDTYGDEASKIGIVTDDIQAQEAAIKSLTKAKADYLDQQWGENVRKINSSDGVFDSIGDWFANYQYGANDNADRVKKQWGDYSFSLKSFMDENSGQYFQKVRDLAGQYGDSITWDGQRSVISGNLEDVISYLKELQSYANEIDFTKASEQIDDILSKAEGFKVETEDFIYSDIYRNKIKDNKPLEEIDSQLEAYSKAYEKAVAEVDTNAQKRIGENVLNLLDDEDFANFDDDVKRYLQHVYSLIFDEIDSWQFDIRFNASDGSKINANDFKNNAKQFRNREQLEEALNGNTGSLDDDQLKAIEYFKSTGASTKQILNKLASNNWLDSKIVQDFDSSIKSLGIDVESVKTLTDDFGDTQKQAWLNATKDCKDAKSAIKAYSAALKEASSVDPLSRGSWLDKLGDVSDGFSKLQAIYNDVADGGDFDFSSLTSSNLGDAFKQYEDEYKAFLKTVSSSPTDINACQDAFDNLVQAFVEGQIGTQNLTEDNEELIASYLKQQGVSNASAVAHRMVKDAVAEETWAKELANNAGDVGATISQLATKANELEAQGATEDANAYRMLAAQKLAAQILVATDAQLVQLQQECAELGIATAAWANYYSAKSGAGLYQQTSNAKYSNDDEQGTATGLYKAVLKNAIERDAKAQFSAPTPNYVAPKAASKDSGGSKEDKPNTVDIEQEWDERAVKAAEERHQKYLDTLEDETKAYSERLSVYNEKNRAEFEKTWKEVSKNAAGFNSLLNGNLDISKYTPKWSEEAQRYVTQLGEQIQTIGSGNHTYTIQIATILPDGTQLTPEQVQQYLSTLSTKSGQDLLKSDTKKLILQYSKGSSSDQINSIQETAKNYKYLRDVAYGTYKAQKDEIDSLVESQEDYIRVLKEQKARREEDYQSSEQELAKQFGEKEAAKLIAKIKDGNIAVGEWKDEYKDASEEQQDALSKAIEAYDKIKDVEKSIGDAEKQLHEERMKRYEVELEALKAEQSVYEAQQDLLESRISLKEATGRLVTAADYGALIDNANKVAASYEKQLSVLKEQLSETDTYSSEWYNVKSEILSVENNLMKVAEEQAKWNEEIRNIPINLLDQYLARLKAIQALVKNYMSLQTTYGKASTADEYNKLFSIAQDNVTYAMKQQELLKNKLGNYQWGSDKYNETASQIESINDDLSSILEEMVEWNKEILNIPINKLNSVNDQLNLVIDAMTDIESEYGQVIDAVTASIDAQVKDLQDEQQAYDDSIQDQIDGIQDLIDALEKENEARQKLLDVEGAEYDLEKARSQKSLAVIRNGQITYEADQDKIREAQQQLDEAEYNYRIYQLQQQIEQLEKEKEQKDQDYQDEIDKLQQISEKWSEIASNIDLAKNQLKATEYLGEGWLNKVLTGDDAEIYEQFKTLYETMDKDLTQYQEQVASNERIAKLMEQFVTQYENGSITYERALQGINGLVSALGTGLGVNGALDSYKELFSGSSITSLSDILSQLQNSAQTEANNFSNYLGIYKSNNEIISKYTSSWEDLKKSVDEQIKALKAAYEAAQAAATAMRYYSSSGNRDGGSESPKGPYASAGKDYVNNPDGSQTYFNGRPASGSSGPGSGSSYSSSSPTTTIRAPSSKTYRKHDGIAQGAVESTTDDKKVAILQKLSMTPIKDYEMPMLLKKGEVVLNERQQSMLLSNMHKLQSVPTMSPVGTNVVLNMSNLTFNEVNNGQDFANFITKNLSNAVSQSMAKR